MFIRLILFISMCFLILAIRCPGREEAPITPEQLVRILPSKDQSKVQKKYGPLFRVTETDHFKIISDCSLRHQRVVNGLLEQFHQEFYPRFFKKKLKQVRVYLIHGGEDFEIFVSKRGHEDSADSYGFYSSDERAIYTRHYFPSGKTSGVGTLFHEVVHAMVDNDFRKRPPEWFNEGLATICECGRILKGKWVYGNPNPWREAQLKTYVEEGRLSSLQELLTLSDNAFRNYGDEHMKYHMTRSFFLYLLRLDEKKLIKFVKLIRKGKDGPRAIKLATGKKLDQIEKEWKESILKVNFAGDYAHRSRKGEAIEILTKGLKAHPHDGYLHIRMAYEITRDMKKQAFHAMEALKDPRLIYPHYAYEYLGAAYYSSEPIKAIKAYQTAISFQPWEVRVFEHSYKNLAQLLKANDRNEEAEKTLQELERLKNENKREQ